MLWTHRNLPFTALGAEWVKKPERQTDFTHCLGKAKYFFQKMTSFDHENWHTAGDDAHDYER